MKPGIHRALPLAIIGFALGALLVMGLRWAQGLEPLFDPGLGMILAAFMSAGFFVWGMGGFNPEMSTHPHEPETDETGLIIAEPEEHDEVIDEPRRNFISSMWQLSFLIILLFVLLLGFASVPGGFYLRTSTDPGASTVDVGFDTVQLPFDGPEIEVSQLTIFVGLIAFTMLSMGVIAAILSLIFTSLAGGLQQVRANEDYPLDTIPNPARTPLSMALNLIGVSVMFIVLYVLFYYVLIGLIIQNPESLRVMLSVGNALLISLVIIFPLAVLRTVGKAAGGLASALRDLPTFLFQR